MIKIDYRGKFGDVAFVAVTKGQSVEKINTVISAGIKIIGENYVQEAEKKFPHLLPVEKHFIGHLQTNKIKKALTLFDCIQSVDSKRLLEKLNAMSKRTFPIFLQVNLGEENTKSGFSVAEIIPLVKMRNEYPNLLFSGLMAVVSFQNAERNRPFFHFLVEIFQQAKTICPSLHHLSMGTSHDYHIALEEGTTMIRIGTALFGSREYIQNSQSSL